MYKQQDLNGLLFSQSRQEEDEDQSSFQYEIPIRHNFKGILNSETNIRDMLSDNEERFIKSRGNLLLDDDDHWEQNQQFRHVFPQVDGPSVQFPQNSLILSRGNDSSRRSRQGSKKQLLKILKDKKNEEQKVNEVIEKQMNDLIDKLQKKDALIDGLKKFINDLEAELQKKKSETQKKDQQIRKRQQQCFEMQRDHEELNSILQKKDEIVKNFKQLLTDASHQLSCREKEVHILIQEKNKLEQHLRMYQGNQRNLTDFRNPSPKTLKFNKQSNRELQSVKNEKKHLQTQITLMKIKYQQCQHQLKMFEDESKRKTSFKDKKMKELEQKNQELKDQSIKNKKTYEINLQSQQQSFYAKTRQCKQKQQKILELESRIKSLHEDSKKKEEKIRQLLLQLTQKSKNMQQMDRNYQDLKLKITVDEHWIKQKKEEIQKLEKVIKTLKNQKDTLEKNSNNQSKLKKQNQTLKRQIAILQKESNQRQGQSKKKLQQQIKETKRKYQDLVKKSSQYKESIENLQETIKQKERIISQYQKKITKIQIQLQNLKKKQTANIELANKLMMLQSRLSKQQSQCEENNYDNSDKIAILQRIIYDKDQQIKQLKSKSHSNSIQLVDLQNFEYQLAEKQNIIQSLQKELEFKQKSLQFLHNKLLESERRKIQNQAQMNILNSSFYDTSYTQRNQEIQRHYEQTINKIENKNEYLEEKIRSLTKRLMEKQNEQLKFNNPQRGGRFQVNELKARVKQLNSLLLSRQRSITPEALSQQQTVDFLIRVIKKVNHSTEMIKILALNSEFRDSLSRMERQFKR